ncbi:primary-amine oxidase [Kineococcus aurantiacus]|uniref:Amine oxidase n=1 Tax=Kineococcus aurantiacus TaxID=37633 RepID=A0A7Y9AUP6_9ACTN|nr:primary-amine oxidase [Kineococcus aurantiacus]
MPDHPLVPLSGEEFRRNLDVLRASGRLTPTTRFAGVVLAEPPKADVLAWAPGDPVPRRARSVVWDRADNRAHDVVVDLVAGTVERFEPLPGATPNFTLDEFHEVDRVLRTEPRVVQALAARGITDLDLVLLDTWTYGAALMPPQWRDRRLGWVDVWRRGTPGGNPYAHPVNGLKFVVDVNTLELLDVEDGPVVPDAPTRGEYDPALTGLEPAPPLRPLEITQPEGPSFTVTDDGELRWRNWSVRIGFTHREGLVLHQLAWVDGDERREIGYRMSFAEMVVPYRDPSFEHRRRTAYDIGEWGLGYMTTSLELGCDCLGEIRYLDAVLADSRGEPYVVPQAVCLHEEDDAVLWKHVDEHAGTQVRRSRRMVVSFHATVANYEYLVYWRLYLDGTIECEVRATGIMVTTPIAEGAPTPATGVLVDERTYAPIHQHFIVARLDLDVDGPRTTVHEVDTHVVPTGPDNPHGLALATTSTPVRSERESGRDVDQQRQRVWKVASTRRTNAWGTPTAYKLVTPDAIPHLFAPDAPQFLRAPVIGHDVWVTRHHDDELWPAGDHPTQSSEDLGITRWTADDEPLEDTDTVLWHVFGIHHVPRPEDWPVMPSDAVVFRLKPSGFFDRNPALDLPPNPAAHCHRPPTGGKKN